MVGCLLCARVINHCVTVIMLDADQAHGRHVSTESAPVTITLSAITTAVVYCYYDPGRRVGGIKRLCAFDV